MPHKGNRPPGAVGVLRTESNDSNAGALRDWRIYQLRTSTPEWLSLKLVRVRPGKGAANYWLGFHRTARRLARTSEAARMPAALRDAVSMYLDLWLDTGGTDSEAGALLAELDARDGLAH